MTTSLVDLKTRLVDHGDGWKSTGKVILAGPVTSDEDGIVGGERVDDPTRPGRFIYGPAEVELFEAPDGGLRLKVR